MIVYLSTYHSGDGNAGKQSSFSSRKFRTVDGVTYVAEIRKGGVLWHGGLRGGDIWIRKGEAFAMPTHDGRLSMSFEAAARRAQFWARKNYQEALDYVRAYEAEQAAVLS